MGNRVRSSLQDLFLEAVTANATIDVPAGNAIGVAYITNKTANAVTGGIRIGTTPGGSEVLAATPVGPNALVRASGMGVQWFSNTVPQTLYIQAVTIWNSASLDIVITMTQAKL